MIGRTQLWRTAVLVLALLIGLDFLAGGTPSPTGVMLGMALMSLLVGLAAWKASPRSSWQEALYAALRSVSELTLGVFLISVLAAPLVVLLPKAWLQDLTSSERAAELLLVMLLGVGMLVSGRALIHAGRNEAERIAAQRDSALIRVELSERERDLVKAELQLLRAQVEPHFLWNTLANVEYLIRKQPEQAREMLGQLITYLRSTVATGETRQGTLRSEFESVRAYLGIMKFRMGERLQFELSLPSELNDAVIPPLMLQTLVENAIKHGLEPKIGEARLRIVAQRKLSCGKVRVEVQDNGVGLQSEPSTSGTGLGLRNVRDRLQALYGSQGSLQINAHEGGGVSAVIEWPEQKVLE